MLKGPDSQKPKDPRTSLLTCLEKGVDWERHGGTHEHLPVTLSGLLAVSWLNGAQTAATIVETRKVVGEDETGTSSGDYIKQFNGYATQVDDGAQQRFTPDKYTSEIVVGWPQTTWVDLGEVASSKVTVTLNEHGPGQSLVSFSKFVVPDSSTLGHRVSYAQIASDKRPTVQGDKIVGGTVKIDTKKNRYLYTPHDSVTSAQLLVFDGGFVGHPTLTEDEFRKLLKRILIARVHNLLWWGGQSDIKDFDPSTEVFTPSGYMAFKHLALVEDKGDTVLWVIPGKGEPNFSYRLVRVAKAKITEDNFTGMHGNFAEIKHTLPH